MSNGLNHKRLFKNDAFAICFGFAIALLSCLTIIAILMQSRHSEISRTREISKHQHALLSAQLRSNINDHIHALSRMANRWNVRGGTPKAEWLIDAESYIRDYPGVYAIARVSPDNKISWVASKQSEPNLIDINLSTQQELYSALLQSKTTGEAALTSPIELPSGQRGLFSFFPLRSPDFDGFLLTVIELDAVLNQTFSDAFFMDYDLAVEIDGSLVFESTELSSQRVHELGASGQMDIFGLSWKLDIWPTPALVQAHQLQFPWLLMLAELPLAFLAGLTAFISVKLVNTNEALKRKDTKLSQALEELSVFSYRSAHDLKAPIVSSLSLLDHAQSELNRKSGQSTIETVLPVIQETLGNLCRTLQDIIDLNQTIDNANDLMENDLRELLNEIWHQEVDVELRDTIIPELDIPPGQTIFARRGLLRIIFKNLMTNAALYADHSKPENTLRIRSSYDDQCHYFEVEDNGIGIPEKYRDRVFKMFQKLHAERSNGSGLGLYSVLKAITNMRGTIEFSSGNNGTTFLITLPVLAFSKNDGTIAKHKVKHVS